MSRGFIGCTPCYSSFSSQMSGAVGSIASAIGQQQSLNNYHIPLGNSLPPTPIYNAPRQPEFTPTVIPKEHIRDPWDIAKECNSRLGIPK